MTGAATACVLVASVLLTAPGAPLAADSWFTPPVAGSGDAAAGAASGQSLAPGGTEQIGGAAVAGLPTDVVDEPRPVYAVLLAPDELEADPSVTPADVRRVVSEASEWWEAQTGGHIRFETAAVTPWENVPVSCSDVEGLWERGHELAPGAGEAGAHLLVVIPDGAIEAGCQYGFGSMGVLDSGGSVMVSDMVPSLVAHELGHNLGLGHSHALRCPGATDGEWDERRGGWRECTQLPYDDLFGVMGYSGRGFGQTSLNAVHIDQLGVEPGAVRDVGGELAATDRKTTDRENTGRIRVRIPALSSGAPGRAVKISEPDGPTYYLEYRASTGADSAVGASGWNPQLGLRVLRPDPEYLDATGSIELDASPQDESDYQRALPVGHTFTSARGGVQVHLVSSDEAGAVVDIAVRTP